MFELSDPDEPAKVDPSRHPLDQGIPPVWASGWGQDEFGVFTELTVADVRQKMRWIPPGRFLMGSPEDEPGRSDWERPQHEPGRSDWEGPQHKVTIAQGFWLFNTPVTQGLWQVLMDNNPSEFVHPNRPVENISWDDAQTFLSALENCVPGLSFALPSEAEWEYACRAGTMEATYAGPMTIFGENNAPVLDGIAWYGGNSGRDFDLEGGYNTSKWPEKQYPEDATAGTRIVAQKQPNQFGLYDMLGNIWEWCADEWHSSYDGAPSDGSAWGGQASEHDREGRAGRIVRGGAWRDAARYARSAYRGWDGPSSRTNFLGFRCAARSFELKRRDARSAGGGLADDASNRVSFQLNGENLEKAAGEEAPLSTAWVYIAGLAERQQAYRAGWRDANLGLRQRVLKRITALRP